MNILHATGFTGVAAVLLSAFAYAVRISFDASANNPYLTASFIVINLLAWGLGQPLYARNRDSALGFTLLVLGDLIFPLNIYAPVFLYLPVFQGSVAMSASLVIAMGIPHHLLGFLRVKRSRFNPVFYPYFFAGSGIALIQLSRMTLGVSPIGVCILSLLFAVGYLLVAERKNLQPTGHFAIAGGAIALAAAACASVDLVVTARSSCLALLFLCSGLLTFHAMRRRDIGPFSRVIGASALLGLTWSFTGCLFLLGAAPIVYVLSTAAWVAVLAAFGILVTGERTDPFKDSAHWVCVVLGVALAIGTWPSWGSLLGVGRTVDLGPLQPLAVLSVAWLAVALGVSALALLKVAQWRHRNPSIAMTLSGFMANMAFLNAVTYTAPLLAVLAFGVSFASFGLATETTAIALSLLAVAVLVISRRLDDFFPQPAIDVTGVVALVLAAVGARSSSFLASILLISGSLALLWRSLSGSRIWSYASFLALATTGVVMLPVGSLGLRLAVFATVVIFLAERIQPARSTRWAAGSGLGAAAILGLSSLIFEITGPGNVAVFAAVWLGFLLTLHHANSAKREPVTSNVIEALRALTFCVGHFAGGLLVVMGVRLQLPAGLDSVALALWSLFHYALLRFRATGSDPAARVSRILAVHGLALASMLIATTPEAWVVCALSYACACFLIADEPKDERSDLLEAAYALTLLAVLTGAVSQPIVCLLAMSLSALVLLWRSSRDESLTPHALGMLLGVVAAGVASYAFMDTVGAVPLASVSVLAGAIARRGVTQEGRESHLRVSAACAIGSGLAAFTLASLRDPSALMTMAILWIGTPLALTPWLRLGESETDRPSEEAWVSYGGMAVWALSGFSLVWKGLAELQMVSFRLPILALSVAALFLVLRSFGAWRHANAPAVAARTAVSALAILVLVLAAVDWRSGIFAVTACAIISLLFLACFSFEKTAVFEHAAALSVSEGLWILGVSSGVMWPDYYILCVGLYLCLLLARRPQPAESAPASTGDPFELLSGLVSRASILPALTIALMAGYPIVSLVRTLDEMHLAFLTVATILLLNVLIHAHVHPLLVFAVCLTFIFGVSFVAVFANAEPTLWLALVLAGAMIIASLRRAEPVDQRVPTGESR